MQNGHSIPAINPLSYTLPATAHQALTQTRDHLRLLAQLTEPQDQDAPDQLSISAEALACCFDRLADDLERIADAARPSAE
ncbi:MULTISPECIES: hypothetical protein [unclassified Lysobacter]|uniref:XAC0095 family protein n=1 Tax=unclassified Lysobacter TaxID=2635362 RepID=UPI0006FB105E|nr:MULTISPECIES: hypothetical protein [unclassified Lysobacter]KQZ55502.1 hypothetical protein ASD53_14545 [Lysobacter sp. Root559]KRC31436.1 hypothetical protein ASE10_16990 [Lysobacter sp. Root76]KRD65342.1 hypothetical protein ASE45_18195 [Lysobacter sp. Root96]